MQALFKCPVKVGGGISAHEMVEQLSKKPNVLSNVQAKFEGSNVGEEFSMSDFVPPPPACEEVC